MSDNSLYCHACHHQWQSTSDAIECPACRSASTEIVRESPPSLATRTPLTGFQITPEHDPRHFHNPAEDAPATAPTPAVAESQPTVESTTGTVDQEMTDAPATESSTDTQGSDHAQTGSNAAPRRPEFVFVFPPPVVTFHTTVVTDTHVPPPDAAGPRGPPVTTHFSVNVFPHLMPRFHVAPTAPQPNAAPNGTEDQPESQQGEHQHGPARTPSFLELLLGSMFAANPANAAFGDAVFSQEALDRIITQLREQSGPGGAPPVSQSAIEKLEVKDLDEKMLGGEEKTRCVICVDEMSIGEKASVLPCNHFFHGECVTPWLKQHNTCPVCRQSIEPEPVKPEKAAQFANEHEPHAPGAQDCS
ncbi:hypothetical protein QBC47DRAFT_218467 [Echria macrotheca]|uniref:RING-type E3 ubiquitin transferase n=1 Tax=Echria macrotheca TaxID=438768 RepID=A0AAJ0BA33_9PEZI|nr:hypothetical protein QBC47DRAFT_218467 [Echria macrotheca]